MQQVIVIHGGTTFKDYDSYLQSLSQKKLDINRFIYTPKWKEKLQDVLGNEYQVLLPSMPNSTNARYSEWKIWFEHISSLFAHDCIIIGHSLGGIFLAKYLSENTLPVKIKATILVAAPYDDQLTEQAGRLVFINGLDDPVVPATEMKKYQRRLPNAEFIVLPAPDHFVREKFPELIYLLKSS